MIDKGLRNAVAFYFSEDAGRLLENMVFIELRRRGREVFFSKGQGECDFLVRDKKKISQLIQVSWQLDNDNRGRELSGLKEAMEIYGLREGLILTKNQAEEIEIGRNRITVMPAYKWLLE